MAPSVLPTRETLLLGSGSPAVLLTRPVIVSVAWAASGARGTTSAASTRVAKRNRRIRISRGMAERGGTRRAELACEGQRVEHRQGGRRCCRPPEAGRAFWILYAKASAHDDPARSAPVTTRRSALGWFHHARADQVIQAWELAVEVGITLGEHEVLPAGSHAAAGAFAVAGVQAVHHIHSLHHVAERREALGVLTEVVATVDHDLGGAGVGARHGEDDRSAHVARPHGIVPDRAAGPDRRHRRVTGDP